MRKDFFIGCCIVALLSSATWLKAEDIRGEVAEVTGAKVRIALTGKLLPQAGDPVKISQEIPGTGIQALVGSGKVISAKDGEAYVVIEKKSAEIKVGQVAEIAATAAKTGTDKKEETKKEETKKDDGKKETTKPESKVDPPVDGKELLALSFAETPESRWQGTIAALKADGTVKAKPSEASKASKIGLGAFLAATQSTESKRRPPSLFPVEVMEVDEDGSLVLKVGPRAARSLERGAPVTIIVRPRLTAEQLALLPAWIESDAVRLLEPSASDASVRVLETAKGVVAVFAPSRVGSSGVNSTGDTAKEKGPSTVTVQDKCIVLSGFKSNARALTFTPKGQRLLIRCAGRELKVWDIPNKREVLSLVTDLNFPPAAMSGDGWLAVGHDGAVSIHDVLREPEGVKSSRHRGQRFDTKISPLPSFNAIAFSQDGSFFALGDKNTINCFTWHEQQGGRFIWSRGAEHVTAMDFSPNGHTLAVAAGSKVQLLQVETGNEIFSIPEVDFDLDSMLVETLRFSPRGDRLLAARLGKAASLRVWELDKAPQLLERHNTYAGAAAWSETFECLAGISEKERKTEVRYLEKRSPFIVFEKPMSVLALSPDHKRLAVRAVDSPLIGIIDIATEKEVATLNDRAALMAFSPDGEHLVSADLENNVRIWRLPSTQDKELKKIDEKKTTTVEEKKKDEPKKDEPKKDEPKKEEFKKEEFKKEDEKKSDSKKEDRIKEDSKKEEKKEDVKKAEADWKLFDRSLWNTGYDFGGLLACRAEPRGDRPVPLRLGMPFPLSISANGATSGYLLGSRA